MLNDGEGVPEDEGGRVRGVVQAGDAGGGGEGLPLGLGGEGGEEGLQGGGEGEAELAEEEVGAEGPGGVVFVGYVEGVGGGWCGGGHFGG